MLHTISKEYCSRTYHLKQPNKMSWQDPENRIFLSNHYYDYFLKKINIWTAVFWKRKDVKWLQTPIWPHMAKSAMAYSGMRWQRLSLWLHAREMLIRSGALVCTGEVTTLGLLSGKGKGSGGPSSMWVDCTCVKCISIRKVPRIHSQKKVLNLAVSNSLPVS